MKNNKKIPRPKPAQANIVCECGARIPVTLLPGSNVITAICGNCGAVININVNHDGYGGATIYSGTIEQIVNPPPY